MSRGSILYIEDAVSLAAIVKDTLQGEGYEVHWFEHGQDLMSNIKSLKVDLVILDIMLPGVDGFHLAEQIASSYSQLPFIFTSAKNQTTDVIQGLKLGAKDYLKKPFHLEELLLRIDNILASAKPNSTPLNKDVYIGKYALNSFDQTLTFEGAVRNLTHLETEIISYLAQRKNAEIIKRDMLTHIWGDDTQSNSRNLDVYINKVRDYLSKDAKIRIITLRAKGYRFIIED